MKTIDEDIKNGQIKQIYLLYGEEAYLKKQYRNKIKNAVVAEGDNMNFSSFEGKGINTKELIDLAETLPFFADKRLILIENSGFFKNTCDDLAEYLKEVPASVCFVFVEEEVDKRSKMYKAVKGNGCMIAFDKQNEDLLIRWISSRVKKENKNITGKAMQLFFTKTGADMGNINQELEKLFCYTLDKDSITPEDVEAICVGQTTNKIFDMVNAIAMKNQAMALHLYYDLLALKEPPMRILFLISRQFQILITLKDMKSKHMDNKSMASRAGVPPFAVQKNLTQAASFTLDELRQALQDGVQAEEDIKTGRFADQLAVELLIVKYSNHNK